MNKLDVALRLLQLLNERKTIDSKLVANELSVSLRTAQRYLVELSILPCVISKHNNHTYCLNPDYQMSGILKPAETGPGPVDPSLTKAFRKYTLSKTFCVLCGNERGVAEDGAKLTTLSVRHQAANITKIDKLAAIISRRMKSGKC